VISQSNQEIKALDVYIPIDRRQVMTRGEDLPDRTNGTALFADISGFTPLTDALVEAYGHRRAVEELTHQLNHVYDVLITEIHRYGGSVIGFVGDAITCWFDANLEPSLEQPALRATACGLAMQQTMEPFIAIKLPSGDTISLIIKIGIATGPAYRYRVGDPKIQYIDTLTGRTLQRMAAAYEQAQQGEVVLDAETASQLGDQITIIDWRIISEAGHRFAVVDGVTVPVSPKPWPSLSLGALPEAQVKPWLLAPFYERLSTGQDQFLAELRPVVALFMKFSSLDYDQDETAGRKLDEYIRWVQQVLEKYGGHLIQLTIGDKGSFLYAAFGAPIAHDDDSVRAVSAALELQSPPETFAWANQGFDVKGVQIGITQGQMRTGAYGSPRRRTYGVIGDQAILAARLMSQAKSGQTLVSKRIAVAANKTYQFEDLGTVALKGKQKPMRVFEVLERRKPSRLETNAISVNALVGRTNELTQMIYILETARSGQGQILRLEGIAGIGKSHLSTEFIKRTRNYDIQVAIGICQGSGPSISYYPWRQIFRTLFNFVDESFSKEDPETSKARQIFHLEAMVRKVNPEWHSYLPLFGDLLGVPIPDNSTTAQFDVQVRYDTLFALAIEIIRTQAKIKPLLIFFENAHWMDEASRLLALAIGRMITEVPILLVLVHRPPSYEGLLLLPELNNLLYYHHLYLRELSPSGLSMLVADHLPGKPAPLLLSLIQARAEGNPLFTEELIEALRESNTLYRRPSDGKWTLSETLINRLHQANCLTKNNGEWQLADNAPLNAADLGIPNSIHGLIQARIDTLPERYKLILKVASVIGQIFLPDLLAHVHPAQPDHDTLQKQLTELETLDLIYPETTLSGSAYLFKHQVIQEVAYEMLLFDQRRRLHSAVAIWYEQLYDLKKEQKGKSIKKRPREVSTSVFPLLAFHYQRAEDIEQERHYSKLAGERAAAQFANVEALRYFSRALHLTPENNHAECYALLLARERIYDVQGERENQAQDLAALQELVETLADKRSQAELCLRQANYAQAIGNYSAASLAAQEAIHVAQQGQLASLEAEGHLQWGQALLHQEQYEAAQTQFQQALSQARTLNLYQVEADCLRRQGIIAWLQAKHIEAGKYFMEALHTYQERNDRIGESWSLNNLGVITQEQSFYTKAMTYYEQALQVFHEISFRKGEAQVLTNLGKLFIDLGRYEQAKNHVERAISIYHAIDDRRGESEALTRLSLLAHNLGDSENARKYSQQAWRMAQKLNSHRIQAQALFSLGHSQATLGYLVEADNTYQQTLKLWRELSQPNLAIEALAGSAQVSLLRNDLSRAQTQAEEIFSHLEGNSHSSSLWHGLEGAEEPFKVCLVCYRILNANQDPRAQTILNHAYKLLHEQAGKISDEALRYSFLKNVSAHHELIEEWEELNKSSDIIQ